MSISPKRIYILTVPVFLLFLCISADTKNHSNTKKDDTNDTLIAGSFLKKAQTFFDENEYDSAIYYLNNATPLFRQQRSWRRYIHCLLLDADIYRIKSEYDAATDLLSKAEKISFQYLKPDDIIFSRLFHIKGTISSDKGDFNISIEFLKKSIEIRQVINGKEDTKLSHSFNYIGNNYFYLGDYEEALKYYKKALEIAMLKEIETDPDVAMYNQNIGIIYAIRGDYDEAMQYFIKSLSINQKILSNDDPALAQIYFNIGRLSNLIGKYDDAISYYNRARKIYVTKFGNNHPRLGRLYLDEGSVYYENGDYDKALNYYFNSLNIFQKNYEEDHPDILKVYNNIGNIYFQKNDFNKALEYYLKIIDNKRNVVSTVITARNLANCYNELGYKDDAKKYYEFAIEKCKKELEPDHPELANSYLVLGSYCIQNNDFDKANELFQNAYEIYFKKFGDKNPDVSKSLVQIGNYYLAKKDYSKAIEYYQKSITAIVDDYNDNDPRNNPELNNIMVDYYLLNSLLKKAETWELYYSETKKLKDLETGLETYTLAINLIDKIRTGYQTQESKLFLTENVRNTFIKTIHTNLHLFSSTGNLKFKEAAFSYAEKSKSSILLASVRDLEAKISGGIPDSLQKLEKDIKAKIVVYDNHIYEERLKKNPDLKKIKLWDEKLFDSKQKLDELVSQLEEDYPKYYNLKYDNKVLELSGIQKKLQNRAMIEYTLSDSILYTFVVRNDFFEIYEQAIDSSFFQYIDDIRESVNSNDFANHNSKNFKDYVIAAYQLYQKLIFPIDDVIKERELIIIPDDKLGYIPFESLITSFPDTSRMDYRKLTYLIKDYLINYSYSATILFDESLVFKRKSNKKLLAFAPTYQNKEEINNNEYIVSRGLDDYLIPIPGVKEEITNIEKILKAKIFEGLDATEKNFKNQCSEYDILHLAMHTIIDDENPMFSRLVFTINNDDTVDDGFLNTYEIYNMNLTARMAVLSACNTGTGRLQRGEGIISLARGFIYAGVPGIVMTLWSVEDKSGAEIMTAFYKYIKEGFTKNEALRKAKLDYLNEANAIKAHPYFWSAYVNIGNTDSLIEQSFLKKNIYFIVPVILILIISSYIILRKVKKKKA